MIIFYGFKSRETVVMALIKIRIILNNYWQLLPVQVLNFCTENGRYKSNFL